MEASMLFRRLAVAFSSLTLTPLALHAQTPVSAGGDTVILIVKSPRGHEITFSGTIVLRDYKTTRRFDKVKTPFELRLPAQDVDARFEADDGQGLDGEIVMFRGGAKRGQVWGTVYRGTLKLYSEPGKGFGFGERTPFSRAVP
jgi:hypothetical protein